MEPIRIQCVILPEVAIEKGLTSYGTFTLEPDDDEWKELSVDDRRALMNPPCIGKPSELLHGQRREIGDYHGFVVCEGTTWQDALLGLAKMRAMEAAERVDKAE